MSIFRVKKTVFIVNAKTHATGSNILQPCITTEIHMFIDEVAKVGKHEAAKWDGHPVRTYNYS